MNTKPVALTGKILDVSIFRLDVRVTVKHSLMESVGALFTTAYLQLRLDEL